MVRYRRCRPSSNSIFCLDRDEDNLDDRVVAVCHPRRRPRRGRRPHRGRPVETSASRSTSSPRRDPGRLPKGSLRLLRETRRPPRLTGRWMFVAGGLWSRLAGTVQRQVDLLQPAKALADVLRTHGPMPSTASSSASLAASSSSRPPKPRINPRTISFPSRGMRPRMLYPLLVSTGLVQLCPARGPPRTARRGGREVRRADPGGRGGRSARARRRTPRRCPAGDEVVHQGAALRGRAEHRLLQLHLDQATLRCRA